MASLLIEELMINNVSLPFFTVFEPGRATGRSFVLNPLEHLNTSGEFQCIINVERESFVVNRSFGPSFTLAVDQRVIILGVDVPWHFIIFNTRPASLVEHIVNASLLIFSQYRNREEEPQ